MPLPEHHLHQALDTDRRIRALAAGRAAMGLANVLFWLLSCFVSPLRGEEPLEVAIEADHVERAVDVRLRTANVVKSISAVIELRSTAPGAAYAPREHGHCPCMSITPVVLRSDCFLVRLDLTLFPQQHIVKPLIFDRYTNGAQDDFTHAVIVELHVDVPQLFLIEERRPGRSDSEISELVVPLTDYGRLFFGGETGGMKIVTTCGVSVADGFATFTVAKRLSPREEFASISLDGPAGEELRRYTIPFTPPGYRP
ncbi:MAG: hypothetical protein H0V44_07840 [Planctomycetes bacterium]|nr:hypothetical protein [Planctomycetota bacterium]